MLNAKNLSKRYTEKWIIEDLELEVNEGEVVSLIGPSGAGKSTLLKCLNYIEKPNSGIINIEEKEYDLLDMSEREIIDFRQNFAMIFQDYSLFKNLTILENVAISLKKVKGMVDKDANELAKLVLDRVDMLPFIDTYPSKISGGQQQRVGIARAMALKPKIFLMDEPTSSLDPVLVTGILEIIRDLAIENHTMIIATHEMGFARKISDRIIFMVDGDIIEQGPPEQIFNNPKDKRTEHFLNEVNKREFFYE